MRTAAIELTSEDQVGQTTQLWRKPEDLCFLQVFLVAYCFCTKENFMFLPTGKLMDYNPFVFWTALYTLALV